MSSEERLAVKDVVMDKISDGEENVPPEQERYKCDHCPISFTMQDNLSEHLERKHKKGKLFKTERGALNLISDLDNESSPVFIDTGAVDIKTEFSRKHLTKTTPTPTRENRKQKGKRSSVGRFEKPVLAGGPNMDAGDGKICRLCSKEFPSNGPMRRHFEDIHNPGVYPCKGCQKIFTSKNKVSSHYSRNCKRKTL